jgi:hypothetical protein
MKHFNTYFRLGLIFLLFAVTVNNVSAQQKKPPVDSALMDRITALEQQVANTKPGEDHFMVVGLTTFGFVTNKTVNTLNGIRTTTRTSTFGDASRYEFSPMLLWRHGDKLLLEFEPSFNNDGLSVNWADIAYFVTPGLIIKGGYLVIPFGIYNKRLAAGWINKLATDPIGLGIPSTTDYGVEFEGGLPLGNMKWNYDVAITNGMRLLPDGQLQGTGVTDNNLNKTFTARLGLLPLSNSALEIGVSGLTGKVGDQDGVYGNARGNMFALDLNYIQPVKPFAVNVKAQYNVVNINQQNYVNPNDSTKTYSYNNHSTSYFAMMSLRPSYLDNKVLKNFEVAFRYANYTSPQNSAWGSKNDQVTEGIAYWINWRTVLKLTHENLTGNSTTNPLIAPGTGNTKSDLWFIQFSVQL